MKIPGEHTQGAAQIDLFDALSLDTDSRQVLNLIMPRIGRARAISVSGIASYTGIPDRTVRDIVKHLIERHQVRIGSSLGNPPGYYMIATKEEAEQNEKTLRRLGISILTRAAVLKKLTVKEYMKRLQEELKL